MCLLNCAKAILINQQAYVSHSLVDIWKTLEKLLHAYGEMVFILMEKWQLMKLAKLSVYLRSEKDVRNSCTEWRAKLQFLFQNSYSFGGKV